MMTEKQSLDCIQSEIHSVLSALRQSGRWASKDRFQREIPLQFETPLVRGFKNLREYLSIIEHLNEADCVSILSPFLTVVQNPNVNAHTTSLALSSLNKLFLYKTISQTKNISTALNQTVEHLVEIEFESSDSISDEVVLVTLLETLLNLFRSDSFGKEISSVNSWKIIQCCWKLRVESSSSNLLKSFASNTLNHILLTIFVRFKDTKDYTLVSKVFLFLSQITDTQKNSLATRAFGLELLNIALETASSALCQHDLVSLLQGQLCKNLLQNSQSEDLTVLNLTLRVVFNLFTALKSHLKVQLEVFIVSVHLRLSSFVPSADGGRKSSKLVAKELALESLLDFCREPLLMLDLYINYDCDFNCTNLFETITKNLVSCASPTAATLNSLNVVALDGLLAIVEQVSDFENLSTRIESEEEQEEEEISSKEISLKLKNRKEMKKKLVLVAKEFNKKPLKETWLNLAVELEVIKDKNSAQEVAKFMLDHSIQLSKESIGEFLGDGPKDDRPFNNNVLKAMLKLMDLQGLRIDFALRKVLKQFKLPGEAQKIDRIMEAFGEELFSQNVSQKRGATAGGKVNPETDYNVVGEDEVFGIFENSDAAFTLAFSIILLHTDIHNSAIKAEKKMSVEQFIRNNRGINGGKDFPVAFLEKIYYKTKFEEIKVLQQQANGELEDLAHFESPSGGNNSLLSSSLVVAKYRGLVKDMFNILFEQHLVSLLLSLLELTRDGKVVSRILKGLFNLVKLGCSFGLADKVEKILLDLFALFDKISSAALNRVNVDKLSEEEKEGLKMLKKHGSSEAMLTYAATPLSKCLLLFHTTVLLCKRYGSNFTTTSWSCFVSSILVLNNHFLLPNFFVELDDIIEVNQRNRNNAVYVKQSSTTVSSVTTSVVETNNKPIPVSSSATFWGMVSSFLFTAENGSTSTSALNRDEKSVEEIKELITSWEVREVFVFSGKALSHSSLLSLVETLSSTTTMNSSGRILCLELLTEVAVSITTVQSITILLKKILVGFYKLLRVAGIQSQSISPFKLLVFENETIHIENYSASSETPLDTLLVERIVINLLGISMRMLEYNGEVQEIVLFSLTWLVYLPLDLSVQLSKKIGMGLGTVLSLNFATVVNKNSLKTLFNIMKFYSIFDEAVDHIYLSLAQVVLRLSLIDVDRLELTLDFIRLFVVREEQTTASFKIPAKPLRPVLFSELQSSFSPSSLNQSESFSLGEQSSVEEERERWSESRAATSLELGLHLLFLCDSADREEVLFKVLFFLVEFSRDERKAVREGVRKGLESVLINSTVVEHRWSDIFTKILFPIVDTLDIETLQTSPYLLEVLFSYSKLLTNCLLQRITLLKRSSEFNIIWLRLITVLCKNIKLSSYFNTVGDKLYFTNIEGLKNLLMVLKLELDNETSELMTLTLDLIKSTSEQINTEVIQALTSLEENKEITD